jgi:hypothetical protein
MPAFRACGYVGLAAAFALSQGLVLHAGGSALVMAAVIALACLVFLALAMAQKLLTGAERLVYYHHEIGVLLAAAGLLALAGRAPLAYLDATVLGLGAFLACGRCGCTLAGCCHGRPARRGLRYGPAHVATGFPAPLAGVPLVPVQLLEAAWVALLVVAGTAVVLAGAAPGTALVLYLLLYAVGRFTLELVRGDAVRPVVGGLSTAQWTSVAVVAAVALLEQAGVLPGGGRHLLALPAAAVAVAVLVVRRRPLLGAAHVQEVAAALEGAPAVRRTSLGLRISKGVSGGRRHYTLSHDDGLDDANAARLAWLIARLEGIPDPVGLARGPHGTVHVVEGGAGVVYDRPRAPALA